MSEFGKSVPGGRYRGVDGSWHDAEGRPLPPPEPEIKEEPVVITETVDLPPVITETVVLPPDAVLLDGHVTVLENTGIMPEPAVKATAKGKGKK